MQFHQTFCFNAVRGILRIISICKIRIFTAAERGTIFGYRKRVIGWFLNSEEALGQRYRWNPEMLLFSNSKGKFNDIR